MAESFHTESLAGVAVCVECGGEMSTAFRCEDCDWRGCGRCAREHGCLECEEVED